MSRMDLVTIESAFIRATLAPKVGAAVFSLEALLPHGRVPMLRQSAEQAFQPFDLASTILSPFSNRISNSGFSFEGAFHSVPAIESGVEMAIHGDALHREWTIAEQQNSAVAMFMNLGQTGPYNYAARMEFKVEKNTFWQRMTITNTGNRLPFGGGFHPFFPRRPDTTLKFQANKIWLADSRRIPTRQAGLDEHPMWDFRKASMLPSMLLDNAFTGWNGPAEICQPTLGIIVSVAASPNLDTAIVFAPSPLKQHFCFEPVMHPVDAVNLPGMPGMQILENGESLRFSMQISWQSIT